MDESVAPLNDFSGGLATKATEWMIELNQSPDIRNIDLDIKQGRLVKRKGYVKYTANTIASATSGIQSFYKYRKGGGTTYMLCSTLLDVYKDVSGTWTAITAAGLSNNKKVKYATSKDKVYFVNGTNNMFNWDGTTLTDMGATPTSPPSGCYYIASYKNRLWLARNGTYPSRVWYSALNNSDDWSTADNYGYVDIGKDDGDVIIGIVSTTDKIVIFKRYATYALYGSPNVTDPSSFTWRQISSDVGCINSATIAIVENVIIFLSNLGVYALSPDNLMTKLSDHIQPTIDTIADTTKCVAGVYKNQYWLAYYASPSTANDSVLVLNYRLGAWVKYTGINANCFFYDKETNLFHCGSPTNGDTYTLLSGTTNNVTTLNGAINDSVTTITVVSTDGFLSTGCILIGTELITYTGVGATTFTGCTRGAYGTTKASHLTGVDAAATIEPS